MKALKIAANQTGKRYAIVAKSGGFWVYAECKNYASHVRGGFAVTWRYCARDLSREEAEKLFDRKVAGKAR